MIEFFVAGTVFILFAMGIIQLSLLWAGQSAVETASHFAARKFALLARTDFRKAKAAALAEASAICLQRPGGRWGAAHLTSLDFSRQGKASDPRNATPGDAYFLRLTHWVELCVPWVSGILYRIAPVRKARIGRQYFLLLQSARWVTVE